MKRRKTADGRGIGMDINKMKKRLQRGMEEKEEGEGKRYRREKKARRSSHGRIDWRLLRWSADGGGVGMDIK